MYVTFLRSYMISISFAISSAAFERRWEVILDGDVGLRIAYVSLRELYVHLGESSVDRLVPPSISFRMPLTYPSLWQAATLVQ